MPTKNERARAHDRGPGVESRALVRRFYDEIWNSGDGDAVGRLLTSEFDFRGSLGRVMKGHRAFWAYVNQVRRALADYRCDIVELVGEGESVAARMVFSGTHVGRLLGFAPTGAQVRWEGAAFFHIRGQAIREVWVLGDLDDLRDQLAGDGAARASADLGRS